MARVYVKSAVRCLKRTSAKDRHSAKLLNLRIWLECAIDQIDKVLAEIAKEGEEKCSLQKK